MSSQVGTAGSGASLDNELKTLAARRVFFGHQSVGMDILNGVGDLLGRSGSQALRVTHTTDASALTPGTLAHAAVGKNGDPLGKIRAFTEFMDAGLGGHADVALFKFCYIDVEASTDVDRVFAEYQRAIEGLKQRYPSTRFVHVTMPLRMVQTGPKAMVKKMIGRPLGGYAENMLRNRYNAKLRQAYGNEPFFDLAKVESTQPDGSRTTFNADGQEFFALTPPYTYDNGHLNEDGRVRAAEEFVRVLASAQ